MQGGADRQIMEVLTSHLGFSASYRREHCWGQFGRDGSIRDNCTLGSVSIFLKK